MNYLITGATGFIGGALALRLSKRGDYVRCLVRSPGKTDKLANFKIDLRFGDITVKGSMEGVFDNIDVVFHCAGLLGKFGVSKSNYIATNIIGTRNIIELSAAAKVKKIIFLSSAGVIGPTKGFLGLESSPYCPTNIYEWTKAKAEKCVKGSSLDYVIIRPEFVYGENDYHVLKLFKAIQEGRFFLIGGGNSKLHPTYIDDLINGILLCLDAKISKSTYIIAGEKALTVRRIAEIIAANLNIKLHKIIIPYCLGYSLAVFSELISKVLRFEPVLTKQRIKFFNQDRAFSIDKAKIELGYNPRVGFEEGAKKAVSWYKMHKLL